MVLLHKGFNKPVKYIFTGEANLTKTTVAKLIGLRYFETDSLKSEEVLDFSKYDSKVDIFIIGGKWFILREHIIEMLKRNLKDSILIRIDFRRI